MINSSKIRFKFRKKIILFRIAILLVVLFNSIFAQSRVLSYQSHLEKTIQTALNKILGAENSIVYVALTAEEEKWQINYTEISDIPGLGDDFGSGARNTIVPGIPSLKFLTEGDSGGSNVPLNYEIVQKKPLIQNKEIILILNKKIKLGDLRKVKIFVTKFLNLDEKKGDKLTILKEKFMSFDKADRSQQNVTSKKRYNTKTIILLMIAVLVVGIIFMTVWFIVSRFTRKEEKKLPERPSIISDELIFQKKEEKTEEELIVEEEAMQAKLEEEKLSAVADVIIGNGTRFFNFIDEYNVYKLKFLLQLKISLKQANPHTISIVLSCLPFKLAASILMESPPKIQAEITKNLLELQHFSEEKLKALEDEIKENIKYLFGGKQRLRLILEKIRGDEKKLLLSLIEEKYPAIVEELNSLVVLFEDILSLKESIVGRIFSDIDTEVIATSLVHIEPELQKKVMNTLPKGVQVMVDQWLNLKARSASRYDVENARQKIIAYAQNLEKEGFIKLNSHG